MGHEEQLSTPETEASSIQTVKRSAFLPGCRKEGEEAEAGERGSDGEAGRNIFTVRIFNAIKEVISLIFCRHGGNKSWEEEVTFISFSSQDGDSPD